MSEKSQKDESLESSSRKSENNSLCKLEEEIEDSGINGIETLGIK